MAVQDLRATARVDPTYVWQKKTEDCDRRAAARDKNDKERYDQHARPLPKFSTDQQVRIQDPTTHRWDKVGVVMGLGKSRDYEVRLPSMVEELPIPTTGARWK
ncbi:hypothetical protein Pmani_004955 [Petrolisthes manimaculis]|uniref:Uncharacterized protein n=1 Tax=Petrolisthes manimaculis TaxID=1843537 RepID=A0AAE1UMP6_9EUCA|nr:hypothetical protein Pmani_004955 [Petrolisthes manimaculis]